LTRKTFDILSFFVIFNGMPEERANFHISSAGYGIHWPDLDEDIGVEGLLLGKKSTESPGSFERWLQQRQQKQQVARSPSVIGGKT